MGAAISTKICLDFGITVPVVTILVGGGRGSLKNVRKTLEGQLPVVIVKGSGRLADLLVHVMQEIVPRYNSNVANRVMHALTVTSRCFYRFKDQKRILKDQKRILEDLKKLSEGVFGPTKNHTEIAEDINACINALPAKVSKRLAMLWLHPHKLATHLFVWVHFFELPPRANPVEIVDFYRKK